MKFWSFVVCHSVNKSIPLALGTMKQTPTVRYNKPKGRIPKMTMKRKRKFQKGGKESKIEFVDSFLMTKYSDSRTRSRYKRKLPEERKKRGPKPNPAKVPQTCYECNKTFKCAAQLQLHIRTHSGER